VKAVLSKILVFFAIAASFLPGQGIIELQKIPKLIGHYKQHQQESVDQQLSVFDFLVMHYASTSSHKQEENHDDLPLFNACYTSFLFLSEHTELVLLQHTDRSILLTTEVKNDYDYSIHHSIFQPPRVGSYML
jgi:hypothetical protein